MQRGEFPEMRQFFGFSYLGKDGKFRTRYPTDMIEGAILEHLSASKPPFLRDLISTYEPQKVISTLTKAKRSGILEHGLERIDIRPRGSEMSYTWEVSATMPSRSGWFSDQRPRIRHAFDMYQFETLCTCPSFGEARWICGIWSPIILAEWRLPTNNDTKYYAEHVDAHLEALRFRVQREYDIDVFGFNVEDFMTPYVLAYIDVLERYPLATNYMIDVALNYFSPMFSSLKKKINKDRRTMWPPLEDLKMYDDYYVKEYLIGKLDDALERSKSKHLPKNMDEIIELIGYSKSLELMD